jgi:PAS domain S-box-containing protein
MEEALRLSEEKLSKAFRASPDWMTISTLDEGRYVDINDAFIKMSGYRREEVLGVTSNALGLWANPQDRDRAVETIGKEGYIKNFESKFRMKSGEVRTVLWSAEVIELEGKKCIISINRDITERRKAQEKLEQTLENLRRALGGTVQALAMASETRDPYTAGHQKRVSDLARAIAQEMGLPEDKVEGLRLAGVIHDLGKISVPAEILSKPTKLSDIEFSLIKTHSQIGYDVLKDVDFPWPIARMVLEHHERINGSGYPKGLIGDQILPETKLLMVADVVEAIASHRPYRPAYGIEVALEEIEKNKGILYDSDVVDACLKLFREKGFSLK